MNSIVLEIIVGSAALRDPDPKSRKSRLQVLANVSKELKQGGTKDHRALWSIREASEVQRIERIQSSLDDLIENAKRASKSNLKDQTAIKKGLQARERILRELKAA